MAEHIRTRNKPGEGQLNNYKKALKTISEDGTLKWLTVAFKDNAKALKAMLPGRVYEITYDVFVFSERKQYVGNKALVKVFRVNTDEVSLYTYASQDCHGSCNEGYGPAGVSLSLSRTMKCWRETRITSVKPATVEMIPLYVATMWDGDEDREKDMFMEILKTGIAAVD